MAPNERTDMGGAQSRFSRPWSQILNARTTNADRRN